jgi:hypothetical protein
VFYLMVIFSGFSHSQCGDTFGAVVSHLTMSENLVIGQTASISDKFELGSLSVSDQTSLGSCFSMASFLRLGSSHSAQARFELGSSHSAQARFDLGSSPSAPYVGFPWEAVFLVFLLACRLENFCDVCSQLT